MSNSKISSIYVHIPFCDHICFYCDFVKVKKITDNDVDQYLNDLEHEVNGKIHLLPEKVNTIYFGGGTPSCLNESQLEKLFWIFKKFKTNTTEITIELNPESSNFEKLSFLKQNEFVNRLSIGVQSFNDNLLKKIGRKHNSDLAIEVFTNARNIGFTNISLDLIYNLFNQTINDIYNDLAQIKTLAPDHISWYSLILKDNSIWGKQNKKLPDSDEIFDDVINSEMEKMNYKQYEISNYCLNQKQSQHNLAYWTNRRWLGFGVGASSFYEDDNKYILSTNIGNSVNYHEQKEELSKEDYYFQILMMGLRLKNGLNLNEVIDAKKALDFFASKINALVEKGWLILTEKKLKCSSKFFPLLNEVLVAIL